MFFKSRAQRSAQNLANGALYFKALSLIGVKRADFKKELVKYFTLEKIRAILLKEKRIGFGNGQYMTMEEIRQEVNDNFEMYGIVKSLESNDHANIPNFCECEVITDETGLKHLKFSKEIEIK